jgi:N-acetylmuramoyl-L-alanine amidase
MSHQPHSLIAASFPPDSPYVHAIVPALNVEPRRDCLMPRYLIQHYTGMSSAPKAVAWLACEQSQVSCHYVVDEAGHITQLVPEAMRAWHAGVSHWAGATDLNSASIGIEIQNPGHEHGYPDFPLAQMTAVAQLSRDIVARHGMRPQDVLAHSDIAPGRKIDPGEKFDWRWLHAQGVGHWVEPIAINPDDAGFELGYFGPAVRQAQLGLRAYGYGIDVTGTLDTDTLKVLRAFQLHFRPSRVDGRLDQSTLETLEQLLSALTVTA